MFQQVFKNIDDVLRKEAGCTTELDYTEQTSWLLFLKYLDGLEQDLADEAALGKKKYSYILDRPYRWETWAAPKGKDGKLDHNQALTGDDLRDFVDEKLFPYLQGFTQKATGPNTIEYKIGEIFGEIKNKIFHGQLTARELSRQELVDLARDINAWCTRLSAGAGGEVGYDGFGRNSFQKSAIPDMWKRYKRQLASVTEYEAFITTQMER